jgi:hypothetical protein
MIHRSEAELSQMDPAERQKMSTDYGAFTRSFVQSGHFKAGDGLQPTTTASTVRVRDGKILAADGPFAETRKQLGGYYLGARARRCARCPRRSRWLRSAAACARRPAAGASAAMEWRGRLIYRRWR